MEQKILEVKRDKGLAYYRRRRPFTLRLSGQPPFNVTDVLTDETIGSLTNIQAKDKGFSIIVARTPGRAKKLMRINEQLLNEVCTADEAANRLWRAVHPIQSRVWLGLRSLAFIFDRGFRFVDLLVRGLLVFFGAWFILDWAWFFFDTRALLQDIVLQWLKGLRG